MVNFVELCESVINEFLARESSFLIEAETEHFPRIAKEAENAKKAKLTSSNPAEKAVAEKKLKELQAQLIKALNYGTRDEYMIKSNDELEPLIHEIAHQPGPFDLSGLANLKPSVIGDYLEQGFARTSQANGFDKLFASLKSKGKNIFQALSHKRKTGKYQ
jgi:hypothetical protein